MGRQLPKLCCCQAYAMVVRVCLPVWKRRNVSGVASSKLRCYSRKGYSYCGSTRGLLAGNSNRQPSNLRNGVPSMICCGISDAVQTQETILLDLPTRDVREYVSFGSVMNRNGKSVVVTACDPRSVSYERGVVPGMRLVGISDPMRDTIWELTDTASLRYVKDTIKMRHSDSICLIFVPATLSGKVHEDVSGMSGLGKQVSSSNSGGKANSDTFPPVDPEMEANAPKFYSEDASTSGDSMRSYERLLKSENALMNSNAAARMKKRMSLRKNYMQQASERNDTSFFFAVSITLVLPSVVILSVAYFSGYLDALAMAGY